MISGFFSNLRLPQSVLERRGNLYCVQTSSFLFVGMWRVCNSSKIKHPGGSGTLSSGPKGEPGPARYPFSLFFIILNHTPAEQRDRWLLKHKRAHTVVNSPSRSLDVTWVGWEWGDFEWGVGIGGSRGNLRYIFTSALIFCRVPHSPFRGAGIGPKIGAKNAYFYSKVCCL